MTLEEIDQSLPNGFHDSPITEVRVNYVQRTVEIDRDLWMSGPDDEDTESYRPPLYLSLNSFTL